MMEFRTLFLWVVLSVATITYNADAANNHRAVGRSKELKRMLDNPKLSDNIKGKTLRQLGVKPESGLRQGGRRGAESDYHLFAIYEEFGPDITRLGETAGLRGYLFDFEKYGNNQLTENDIVGAIRGTCSVVGGHSGEDHFCTYEILIRTAYGDEGFGTVISSGSLTYEVDNGGYLLVEGLGNDFEYQDQGGICTMTYRSTGQHDVLEIDIDLA